MPRELSSVSPARISFRWYSRSGIQRRKTDQNIKSNIFSLAGDVVFQVDIFGRYRRATEAARAQPDKAISDAER